MRVQLPGHGASRGSALGRARLRLPHALDVSEQHIQASDVEAELARLHVAIDAARGEMQALRERLHGALAKEVGEFLDLHALLLDDPELLQGLDALIRKGLYTADYALRLQRDRLAAVFDGMDDAYLKSRMDDLDHVIGRIHAHLQQRAVETQGAAGDILITDNIAPSELAQLQSQGVVAIVTSAGSSLSHSAILARSLHMPLVVGASTALQRVNDGDPLIVDGGDGTIIVNPDAEDLQAYQARRQRAEQDEQQLAQLRTQPNRTRDGIDIALYANAESPEDVARAHALGASGLGLYRTEFLFLQRSQPPGEDEQLQFYRDVILRMQGRPVTIRTLDLGSDKIDRGGLAVANEANPALGLRGVRLSLAQRPVFEAQLRAIVRAAAHGPVRILVPMVSNREEILQVRECLQRIQQELLEQGHPPAASLELGAMIEVPAAAIAMHGFIDLVDFVSIGTNDLVQYLLAADRDNEALGELYSPLHPGVLRLLHHVISLGTAHGKPVSVCGEIAGDPKLVPMLLALGLQHFSLHPASLLEVRRAVRECHLGQLHERAALLVQARDRNDIEHWLSTPLH